MTTPVGVGGNEYLLGQDFTEELKTFGIDATFEYVEGIFWDNRDNGEYDIGFWKPVAQPAGQAEYCQAYVYNTTLCALSLMVYYRYLPTFTR